MTIAGDPSADQFSVEQYFPHCRLFVGGVIDQIAELDDREIDTDWLIDLADLVGVAESTALVDGARIAAAPEAIAAALTSIYTDPEMLADPDRIPARALILMMRHLSRMASWAQATRSTLMAAFSRPGVAVPIDEVMDAVVASLSISGIELDETAVVRAASTRAVVGDDAWDLTVADQAGRIAAAEVGPALNLTPISARNRVVEAQTFADDLPLTHERWRQGRLDRVRAGIIADRTAVLDRTGKADVEHRLLGVGAARDAERLTPGRWRSAVDRAVILADPEAARRRSARAHQDRSVYVTPREDDMARFAADVRSPIALLAREVLDTAARNLPAECRGDRTLPQLRADVFGDIMTSLATHGRVDIRCSAGVPPGGEHPDTDAARPIVADPATPDPAVADPAVPGSAVRDHSAVLDDRTDTHAPPWVPLGSSVVVTVAASTLAGIDDNPALLAGHGCITADLARALAVSARRATIIVERSAAAPPTTEGEVARQEPPLDAPSGDGPDCSPADPPGAASPPELAPSTPVTPREGSRNASPGDHAAWCSPDLDFGREVYRPPAALRELVLHRDRTCRFPGCAQPSRRCDLDHRVPFDRNASGHSATTTKGYGGTNAGTTCPCNLDLLCRFHHRVKTFTGWSAVRLPGNTLAWTSPLGFGYVDHVDALPIDRWPTPDAADSVPPF